MVVGCPVASSGVVEFSTPLGGVEPTTPRVFLKASSQYSVHPLCCRNASWNSYPLYHTLYETPFVNEHLFDTNELAVHRATGQFWAQLALSFTEPDIYPLNVTLLAR